MIYMASGRKVGALERERVALTTHLWADFFHVDLEPKASEVEGGAVAGMIVEAAENQAVQGIEVRVLGEAHAVASEISSSRALPSARQRFSPSFCTGGSSAVSNSS